LGLIMVVVGYGLVIRQGQRWVNDHMHWRNWLFAIGGYVICCMGATLIIFGHAWPPKQEPCKANEYSQHFQHGNTLALEIEVAHGKA